MSKRKPPTDEQKESNRVWMRAYSKRKYAENPEFFRAKNKKWVESSVEYRRVRDRLKRYKLTPESFSALLESQDNKCSACGLPFTTTPFVDHDHACCSDNNTCGKCVRGLLCNRCNILLGVAKDSIEVLENNIRYLKKWKDQNATEGLS